MCHLASWVVVDTTKGNKELFITSKDLRTKKGKELKEYLGTKYNDDVVGHGAIEHYFDLPHKESTHVECTDFSTPKNFPVSIVKAIKNGDFDYAFSNDLLAMLTPEAKAEYQKIEQPAEAEYEKIEQPARAEYLKIEQPARAEYEKIEQPAYAEYLNTCRATFWSLYANPENRIEIWR